MVLSISEYRDLAVKLLDVATAWGAGRPLEDPVYKMITEGRDRSVGSYSSCGDLAHWLWHALGVRLPWINRGDRYKMGANIWKITEHSDPAALDDHYERGDVLLIWNRQDTSDAHALVVLEHMPDGRHVLVSADAGQSHGPSKEMRTRMRTRGLKRVAAYDRPQILRDFWSAEGRPIRRVARLESILEAADALGALEPVDGIELVRKAALGEL
jgi:hypothetical protein